MRPRRSSRSGDKETALALVRDLTVRIFALGTEPWPGGIIDRGGATTGRLERVWIEDVYGSGLSVRDPTVTIENVRIDRVKQTGYIEPWGLALIGAIRTSS